MLPVLLTVPKSPEDWNLFSFHHRQSHDLIVQSIMSQLQVSLPIYVIDPITLEQPQQWLIANQQFHEDMDSTLNVEGSNLQDVDFNNERQLQAWIYLHWQEHQTAEALLGIAS